MKKSFFTLFFIGMMAFSAQAQKVIGTYHNDYFDKDYEVSASDTDGKYELYLEVAASGTKPAELNFSIDKENIQTLKNNFIDIKNKHFEWSNVAKANNVKDLNKEMNFTLSKATVCWNSGGKWYFSFNHKFKPSFMITSSGNHLTTITEKVQSSSNKYIDETIYWVFSTEKDFDQIINWLDLDKIESLLNKDKEVKNLFK